MKPIPRAAVVLTLGSVFSAVVSSVATLVWSGSFPDPAPATVQNSVLAEAQGWSAANLVIATPLVIGALWHGWHGSLRGRLVWLGALAYFLYTSLEFAVSPPFTALYLLYVIGFACAVSSLIIGVASINLAALPVELGATVPRRTVAIFALCAAGLLTIPWLKDIIGRTVAGSFGWPVGAAAVSHVVHALDLGLQVPLGIATGVMLLRRRPAGLLLAAIMLVNAVCMGAALTAMVLWSTADAGTTAWPAVPFALFWCLSVGLARAFFLSGVHGHRTNALTPATT